MDVLKMLITLIILAFISLAVESSSKLFKHKKEYAGKACPLEDQIFVMTIRRKTACAELCARNTGCTAVTFVQRDFKCTGCNGYYPSSINLDDQPEALFYIVDCGMPESFHSDVELQTFNGNSFYGSSFEYACKAPVFYDDIRNITCLSTGDWSKTQCEYVDCGTPVGTSHVHFDSFDGYSRYGAQLGFSCSPCTYFSLSSIWKITCQANGSWTIPDCVYGPDVGHVYNGHIIPAGAEGCNSTFGSTCIGDQTSVPGPVLRYNGEIKSSCYCDIQCCSKRDCCVDSTC